MDTLSAENFCLQKSKFKNRFMQAGLASISCFQNSLFIFLMTTYFLIGNKVTLFVRKLVPFKE